MARPTSNLRFGVLLLALVIALFLWGVAHGTSRTERVFDIPIELKGIEDDLVVVDQSVDDVNIRVMGSPAALRNVTPSKLRYALDVSGSNPGVAEYRVENARIEEQLPRGARVVSRSPSRIEVRFERRGRKAVGVRPDLEGEPPAGFRLVDVTVVPSRVWLVGARSHVLRLNEVVTEPINLTELEENTELEVGLYLGSGSVWMEDTNPVKVLIQIEAETDPQVEQEGEPGVDPAGSEQQAAVAGEQERG